MKPPLVKPAKANYQTEAVKYDNIQQTVKGVAEFQPVKTTDYQYEGSGGMLHQVLVNSGDTVKKGQVLVQLETGNLELDTENKLLQLKKDQLQLANDIKAGKTSVLDVDRLQVQIDELDYNNTLKQYQRTQLVAQAGGLVTYVTDAKPGDRIDPYQILVSVADTGKLRLEYDATDSSSLSDVRVGMPVEVDFNDKTYQGKVVQTPDSAPQTTNQQLAQKYQTALYISMDKLPDKASIGQMADIKIITAEKTHTLVIPTSALHNYMGRSFVQVMNKGQMRETDVEVGLKTSTDVEILKGLQAGQQVIVQ